MFQCIPIAAAWDTRLRPPPIGTGTARCFTIQTFSQIGMFNTSTYEYSVPSVKLMNSSHQHLDRLSARLASRPSHVATSAQPSDEDLTDLGFVSRSFRLHRRYHESSTQQDHPLGPESLHLRRIFNVELRRTRCWDHRRVAAFDQTYVQQVSGCCARLDKSPFQVFRLGRQEYARISKARPAIRWRSCIGRLWENRQIDCEDISAASGYHRSSCMEYGKSNEQRRQYSAPPHFQRYAQRDHSHQ